MIEFSNVDADEEKCREIEEMFSSPVIIMKRSKSGEKECDITSLIKSVRAETTENGVKIYAITSADQENYLNPEYVAQAVDERFSLSGEQGSHFITRTKLFIEDGETEFM